MASRYLRASASREDSAVAATRSTTSVPSDGGEGGLGDTSEAATPAAGLHSATVVLAGAPRSASSLSSSSIWRKPSAKVVASLRSAASSLIRLRRVSSEADASAIRVSCCFCAWARTAAISVWDEVRNSCSRARTRFKSERSFSESPRSRLPFVRAASRSFSTLARAVL